MCRLQPKRRLLPPVVLAVPVSLRPCRFVHKPSYPERYLPGLVVRWGVMLLLWLWLWLWLLLLLMLLLLLLLWLLWFGGLVVRWFVSSLP